MANQNDFWQKCYVHATPKCILLLFCYNVSNYSFAHLAQTMHFISLLRHFKIVYLGKYFRNRKNYGIYSNCCAGNSSPITRELIAWVYADEFYAKICTKSKNELSKGNSETLTVIFFRGFIPLESLSPQVLMICTRVVNFDVLHISNIQIKIVI